MFMLGTGTGSWPVPELEFPQAARRRGQGWPRGPWDGAG